jgi:hypothetical protein
MEPDALLRGYGTVKKQRLTELYQSFAMAVGNARGKKGPCRRPRQSRCALARCDACYPGNRLMSAKVRACVDHLA